MTFIGEWEIHDVASIFPLMSEEEFAGFKQDIEAHGLREPVWTHQGKVIDGRNRLRACLELGIVPTTEEWDGKGSLAEFVVSLNLHRRHLTSSQKAACGVDIEKQLAIEAKERQIAGASEGGKKSAEVRQERIKENSSHKGRPPNDLGDSKVKETIPEPSNFKPSPQSRDEAAVLVGTNPRYIQDAKAVAEADPELHEKVKAGTVSLPRARREVNRRKKKDTLKARAEAAPKGKGKPPWEIRCGDCIEVMRSLDAGCARLIFADPPYNIGIDYGDGRAADLIPEDDYLDWCEEWILAATRLLTDDGSMWVLVGDEFADQIGVILRRAAGLDRRNWLIWYESFGVNCARKFNRCHRHLFYMVKDPKRFVFHPEAVNRQSARQKVYGDKRADPGGKVWDDVWGIDPAIPRLVENSEEHIPGFPTQVPLALLRPIVGCATDPGDLVIDPFSGSGSMGHACLELGRRFLGIEKRATYCDQARIRLMGIKGGSDAA